MSHLEPSYLRYIFDGLEKGDLHPDNAAALPEGLTGLYEAAFEENKPARERQKILETFAIWALLKKEVSAQFVAEILEVTTQDIIDFIATYSSWFTSPESGKYQLYHERLKVYLLQKGNEKNYKKAVFLIVNGLKERKLSEELTLYAQEWIGYYYLLNNNIQKGFSFLKKNIPNQNRNWWEKTFELYCNCVFNRPHFFKHSELIFFSMLTNSNQCIYASKLIAKNFNNINWDSFNDFSHESRFHYILADVLSYHFEEINEDLVINIILNEDHYLSYILAYAWKYNCWKNDKITHKKLIKKIKNYGSPYLRILLIQIDGGRLMLNKKQILNKNDYVDCWEYVSEDFLNFIHKGKNNFLNKYLKNKKIYPYLETNDLSFIIDEFEQLHIKIDTLRKYKSQILKSTYFFEIIEILWKHPAWEIGEIGNDFVRTKLKSSQNEIQIDEIVKWISDLAAKQPTYSIAILIFDIIELVNVTEDYVMYIIKQIINWNDAQIRGQFLASSINFFSTNNDFKWFAIVKEQVINLCRLASDIWETQELLEFFHLFENKLNCDEIEYYFKNHNILNKIPNAMNLSYNQFWKSAEKLRLNGII